MEKQDNTGHKLPKYSKKLRNTGQKFRRYHLCKKNENIQKIQGGPQKCPYFSLAITFTKIRNLQGFFSTDTGSL